jgi:hypothetical protein
VVVVGDLAERRGPQIVAPQPGSRVLHHSKPCSHNRVVAVLGEGGVVEGRGVVSSPVEAVGFQKGPGRVSLLAKQSDVTRVYTCQDSGNLSKEYLVVNWIGIKSWFAVSIFKVDYGRAGAGHLVFIGSVAAVVSEVAELLGPYARLENKNNQEYKEYNAQSFALTPLGQTCKFSPSHG